MKIFGRTSKKATVLAPKPFKACGLTRKYTFFGGVVDELECSQPAGHTDWHFDCVHELFWR